MAIPADDLTTDHLDAPTDDPSQARLEIKAGIDKMKALLAEALVVSDEAQSWTAIQKWAKGADVASAATLPIGDDGNYYDVTGSVTIAAIASKGIGTVIILHFTGAPTLTHHATNLILPNGVDIKAAAGDMAIFVEYASGDWKCTNFLYSGAVSGYKYAGGGLYRTDPVAGTWTTLTSNSLTGIPAPAGAIGLMVEIRMIIKTENSVGQRGGEVFGYNNSAGTSKFGDLSTIITEWNATTAGTNIATIKQEFQVPVVSGNAYIKAVEYFGTTNSIIGYRIAGYLRG